MLKIIMTENDGRMKNDTKGKLGFIWDILKEKIHFKICEGLMKSGGYRHK